MELSKIPYTTKIYCPLLDAEETVNFYEADAGGEIGLRFLGCDHLYSACKECEACRKEAYQKMISEYRNR